MKNLENFGVLEMNSREMRETEGGDWIADFVANLLCKCAKTVRPGFVGYAMY